MSNIFPSSEMVVPSEEDERSVFHLNGHVFTTPMKHCRPKHLWPTGLSEMLPEWVEPVERYLAAFAEPVRTIADEVRCPSCDLQVTGHHIILADYRYKTNINYSPEGTMEGRCTGCGYPCRLKHDIFVPGTTKRIVGLENFPLFYHPSATQRTN